METFSHTSGDFKPTSSSSCFLPVFCSVVTLNQIESSIDTTWLSQYYFVIRFTFFTLSCMLLQKDRGQQNSVTCYQGGIDYAWFLHFYVIHGWPRSGKFGWGGGYVGISPAHDGWWKVRVMAGVIQKNQMWWHDEVGSGLVSARLRIK